MQKSRQHRTCKRYSVQYTLYAQYLIHFQDNKESDQGSQLDDAGSMCQPGIIDKSWKTPESNEIPNASITVDLGRRICVYCIRDRTGCGSTRLPHSEEHTQSPYITHTMGEAPSFPPTDFSLLKFHGCMYPDHHGYSIR